VFEAPTTQTTTSPAVAASRMIFAQPPPRDLFHALAKKLSEHRVFVETEHTTDFED
jgi:hypothetical protein